MVLIRCLECFSRYPVDDMQAHLVAHGLASFTVSQRMHEARQRLTYVRPMHRPDEGCNCRAIRKGVKDYCEVLLERIVQ